MHVAGFCLLCLLYLAHKNVSNLSSLQPLGNITAARHTNDIFHRDLSMGALGLFPEDYFAVFQSLLLSRQVEIPLPGGGGKLKPGLKAGKVGKV